MQPYPRARLVIMQVANLLHYWEVNRVELDPVQREVVLDSIVFALSDLAIGFEQANALVAGAVHPRNSAT